VDTGSNPGAIGIDYMANNKGVRDVTIRGQGSVGLSPCQERGPDRA